MKLAICPRCRVIHAAVAPNALNDADEERAFRITHCKLCLTPSSEFEPLAQDAPEPGKDEFGYPMAVVSWLAAPPPGKPTTRIATGPKDREAGNSSTTKSNFLVVPPEFPRGGCLGSVSGAQPKLILRKTHGKFVEGQTKEELYARFDACDDLVEQLTDYCRRKLTELPEMTVLTLLPRVRRSVSSKGWDLSEAEQDWVMKHVAARLNRAS